MTTNFVPAAAYMGGALLLPVFGERSHRWLMLSIALLGIYMVSMAVPGEFGRASFLGLDLTLLRVDGLSRIFGLVFTINALVAFLFAFKLKDLGQHVAALFYIGASLGVVFAGDLISLYVFWEIMAVASTFLILARKTSRSYAAALHYVLVHLFGGLCLLAGIILHISQTGSTGLEVMTQQTTGTWLMLIGVLVNVSAVPFSSWLSDAYPESTSTGGVILSAYTTKTALYVLLRAFPGWEILMLAGCVMALYGVVYALMESDMRRLLAYGITAKVGFMVAGAGIGTTLALNGAAAHAFASVLYTSLLWMCAGAVMESTGKRRFADLAGLTGLTGLGNLARAMPWTAAFCVIGALTISAVPLTSGFTTKTLIIEAAAREHLTWVWLALEAASVGVVIFAGVKLPWLVFFSGPRAAPQAAPQAAPRAARQVSEAPLHMLLAMGLAAFLCIGLGLYPAPLYALLPLDMAEVPNLYTPATVMAQMQILLFAGLGAALLLPRLSVGRDRSLEIDAIYRAAARLFYVAADKTFNGINAASAKLASRAVERLTALCMALPAALAQLISAPANWLNGPQRRSWSTWRSMVQAALGTGTVPVGVTMLAATLGLACLVAVALLF